jgi:hypothetical protein
MRWQNQRIFYWCQARKRAQTLGARAKKTANHFLRQMYLAVSLAN